jgi:hypothetical protein
VSGDPACAGARGDYQALLRPLFMLSFLVDDVLAEHEFFGAGSVLLSSASNKTAFGLAHLLHSKRRPVRVIGLTSPNNAEFVRSLGCYDDVVTYAEIESLPANQPAAFVDMAGSAELRCRLHRHFGDHLVYSGRIGLTHQDGSAEADELPGAKPVWFFAPDQIRKRAKDWGPGGIEQRFGAAWAGLMPLLQRAIKLVEGRGRQAVERVCRDTLNGRVPPNLGQILTLA